VATTTDLAATAVLAGAANLVYADADANTWPGNPVPNPVLALADAPRHDPAGASRRPGEPARSSVSGTASCHTKRCGCQTTGLASR